MKKQNYLIHVTGATCSGKTSLAIVLGEFFKTEIISFDSRQFYKKMNIGTSVPNKKELKKCKHHFVQHKNITDNYNIGDYRKDSLELLKILFKKNNFAILVGGSGLYADSVIYGLDEFPNVNNEIKKEVRSVYLKEGISKIRELLKKNDPEYFKKVDLNNPQRLIRALEICLSSNSNYSFFIGKKKPPDFFKTISVIKFMERDRLYEKINDRVDKMINQGLENEVKSLITYSKLNSLQTIGYKEWFGYWNKKYSYEKTVELIKRNTRRYAKRQMTWNKKYIDAIVYSDDMNIKELLRLIKKKTIG